MVCRGAEARANEANGAVKETWPGTCLGRMEPPPQGLRRRQARDPVHGPAPCPGPPATRSHGSAVTAPDARPGGTKFESRRGHTL